MHGSVGWRFVLGVIAVLASAQGARAQNFAALLKGQWTAQGEECTRTFTLDLSGDTLQLTDHAERVGVEHVIARRATGFATQVVRSAHGARIGSRYVYEMPVPGQLSVTDVAGHADTVVRCPDPLPANGTPQQFVEAVYTRYASPSGLGGPFGSEASLREFFVPELARLTKAAVLDQEFRVAAADCKTDQEPFIPTEHDRLSDEDQMMAFDDVDAGKVRVTAPPVPPDATQATVQVSIGDLGKQGEMKIMLERTPAGWRISDTLSPSGLSFRANIVACVPPQPAAREPRTRARSRATPQTPSRP